MNGFSRTRPFVVIIILFYSSVFCAIELSPWKVFVGDKERSAFGWSICGADVNGDGINDLIVGAPMYSPTPDQYNCGAIFVYLGGTDMDTLPDYIIYGEYPRDQFGISVASAGDFNGDGYEDIIVGANVTRDIGRAYIFLGGPEFGGEPFVVFDGEEIVDNYGYSVSGAGDINQDGYDDVIVGALYNDARGDRTGRAYLYFGREIPIRTPDLIFTGPESLMDFGCYISSPFDYNGDGAPDILIGAPEAGMYWMAPGEALIFFGGTMLDTISDIRREGENPMDFYGGVVTGIGRFNADRFDDFAVGAYNNSIIDSSAGRVYIYLGGETISTTPYLILNGHTKGEGFGNMVASTNDFDGNGFDDLAVSGNYNILSGDTTGMVFIYSGGFMPDTIFDYYATGENKNDRFGWFIAPLGDINGDSLPDIAIGANGYENEKGKVYLYLGFRSLVPPEVRIIEPFNGARTSCEDQVVKVYLFDPQGIDTSSIRINLNGIDYFCDSHTITINDTVLSFTPPENFYDGEEVRFCVEDIANIRGIHIDEPICITFTVDLTPPSIYNIIPSDGSIVKTHQPTFTFRLTDDISGYNFSLFSVKIGDTSFIYPDTSISVVEQKGEFSVVSTGIYFHDMDTIRIELSGVRDNPDFCEPNQGEPIDVHVMVDLTWQAKLTLEEAGFPSEELVIGQARQATNGFDPGIDRIYIPGTPETPNMRIALSDPSYPYIRWLVNDYRSSLSDTASWKICIDGTGNAKLKWNPRNFPEGIVLLNGIKDMRLDSITEIDLPETLTLSYIWFPMKKRTINLNTGWNLISAPLYPSNPEIGELTGIRWLFYYRYNGSTRRYERITRIGPGIGIFVCTFMPVELRFVGCDAESLLIPVERGWNLIGGPSFTLPVERITTIPPNIVELSSIYSYNTLTSSYENVSALEQGRGYWIFALERGIIKLRR